MDKLQKLTWDGGNILPSQIENVLDEKDKIYYEEYNKIINKYSKTQSYIEIDVTKDYTPPKDLYVEVRALDNGKIKEKNGNVMNININQTYLLKKSDIDLWIRRGLFTINE